MRSPPPTAVSSPSRSAAPAFAVLPVVVRRRLYYTPCPPPPPSLCRWSRRRRWCGFRERERAHAHQPAEEGEGGEEEASLMAKRSGVDDDGGGGGSSSSSSSLLPSVGCYTLLLSHGPMTHIKGRPELGKFCKRCYILHRGESLDRGKGRFQNCVGTFLRLVFNTAHPATQSKVA